MEEIGKVNGEHLARHLFLTRRACHAISRSLPFAHGPLCSFHSMDGVERSGEEEGKVNRDEGWGEGTMVGEQPFEFRSSSFSIRLDLEKV